MAPEEARWWSWRRQRLDRTARGIEDALRSVIAITGAQPQGPLALLARVPRMLPGLYDGSLRARVAVRLPAMRRAVWLLAAETAHVPFHACRGTGVTERSVLRRSGVGPDLWNELRDAVLALAGKPIDAREIKEAIPHDREKVSAVLSVLASTGEILRVRAPSITSNAFAFVGAETWLGRVLPSMPRDDALTFLAGDYLQAYGPITLDDFVWWTGLPEQRCEQALMTHEPTRLDGGYLLWPSHARAFEQSRPLANRVNLLPGWDPYPMGYLHRDRLGDAEAIAASFDRAGNSLPIVLVEGRIAGHWDFRVDRANALTVTVSMLEDPGTRLWGDIEAEAGAVAGLLQARSVTVVRTPRRPARAPLATPVIDVAPPRVTAAKNPAARRSGARKSSAATPARKAPSKKAPSKKAAAKRGPVKRGPVKRAPVKQTRAKRAATKKPATTRVPAKKPAKTLSVKKPPVKKAAKKAPAKRAPARRGRGRS